MAEPPSHKLGQIIGNTLEHIFEPIIQEVLSSIFYLDSQVVPRDCRKSKLKLTDNSDNAHELDFVIEKSGSNSVKGQPVAFIESAWRRYKKHSKNKAQEIQAAILPLYDKYRANAPFLGVTLSGEFTAPAIKQLKTSGFEVLYIPFDGVISAFR